MDVIDQRRRDLGGFEVGRVLPFTRRHMVGPFIFFDHIGPKHFSPGFPKTVDVRPHPHIGLATVTYLFAGEIMHRDSVGVVQAIQPEEVNWMIAGRGITHSERFEKARAEGGALHGIQAWVALPNEHEETDPSFAHYDAAALPRARGRRTAHALVGRRSFRAPRRRQDPLAAVLRALGNRHRRARRPARRVFRARAVHRRRRNRGARPDLMAPARCWCSTRAKTPPSPRTARATLMALGGEPVGERFIEWNFVSSSKERIEQAKADWRAGRMKLPDFDNQEFIPLA